jgi:hypothetical protein
MAWQAARQNDFDVFTELLGGLMGPNENGRGFSPGRSRWDI